MTPFRFRIPIQLRYGDLDAQWHINNARFLSFMEHARFSYLLQLGLFEGHNFLEFPLIVADIHIAFLAPIEYDEPIEVGMRVTRIGNKSLTIEYLIENTRTGEAKARAEYVMVTFDYHAKKSVPVWPEWREKIAAFEGIPAGTPAG
jgi:acyl-CoA thioester hydrolase